MPFSPELGWVMPMPMEGVKVGLFPTEGGGWGLLFVRALEDSDTEGLTVEQIKEGVLNPIAKSVRKNEKVETYIKISEPALIALEAIITAKMMDERLKKQGL